MICERCHGTGLVDDSYFLPFTREERKYKVPCPECGGTGITHCCEGERPDCAPPQDAEGDQ